MKVTQKAPVNQQQNQKFAKNFVFCDDYHFNVTNTDFEQDEELEDIKIFANFLNSKNMMMINKFREIDKQLIEDLKKDSVNQKHQIMFLNYSSKMFMQDSYK